MRTCTNDMQTIQLFRRMINIFIIVVFSFLIHVCDIYAGTLKDEANTYREKGYESQQRGDIDEAIAWYQKTIAFDPDYAAPHNDLGILFESKGWIERAETEYKKALTIDPNYEQAHTNLALLYERKGELEKAAFHWMRRYKLGRSGDPWTEEARNRLEKIGLLETTGEQQPEVRTMEKERDTRRAAQEDAREELLEKKWLGEGRYQAKEIKNRERKEKILARKKREEERRRMKSELRLKRQEERRKGHVERQGLLEERRKKYEQLKQERQEERRKSRLEKQRLQKKEERPSKKSETPSAKVSSASTPKSTEVEGMLSEIENKTEQDIKRKAGRKAGWTKIGGRDRPPRKSEERRVKRQKKSDKPFEDKLQTSLALAEERLRQERMKETIEKNSSEPEIKSSSEASKFYSKAQSYYQHGEYAKALDEIRSGKRANPKDTSLVELEEKIKDKMKEERIKDLYNEGIMRYQQKDFSGAREEFESILNILPE